MFNRSTSLPRQFVFVASITVLGALLAAAPSRAGDKVAGDKVDFSREIRPLLSDRCFECHGPQEKQREGGFRFDVQESVFSPADSG